MNYCSDKKAGQVLILNVIKENDKEKLKTGKETDLILLLLSQEVNSNMRRKNVVHEGFIFSSHVLHFFFLFFYFTLPDEQSS